MQRLVISSFQIEGLHRWQHCDIEDVEFLKSNHRHMFHIKCKKKVTHGNREIEIILFKRTIIKWLENKYGSPCNFDNMSCEHISIELLKEFDLYSCEVLEDGENGASVIL